jgi:hypothetical protein
MDDDVERILHIERIAGEGLAQVVSGEIKSCESYLYFSGRSPQDGWVVASHSFVMEAGRATGILTILLERRSDYQKGWSY